jgi:phosphatidylethanolamine-binding protein (PEBP) family uncharacterized protein
LFHPAKYYKSCRLSALIAKRRKDENGVDAFTAKQIIQTPRSLQGRGTTREAHILVFPRGVDRLVGTAWHGDDSWEPGGPGGGKPGYGGPCPPIGRHRYIHKLYALDITLDLRGATKAQIERAMQGHVLANAELIGTYQKGDR